MENCGWHKELSLGFRVSWAEINMTLALFLWTLLLVTMNSDVKIWVMKFVVTRILNMKRLTLIPKNNKSR